MTNQEIIDKIQYIDKSSNNYCDFLEKLHKFNKEYKKSTFYKTTKISLKKLVYNYRFYNLTNLDHLFIMLQDKIDELDLSNLSQILMNLQNLITEDSNNTLQQFNLLSDFAKIVDKE